MFGRIAQKYYPQGLLKQTVRARPQRAKRRGVQLRYVEPLSDARTLLAACFSALLVDQRCDLEGFLNQAIASKRLQRHRQHAGIDHMYRDNLKSFSDFVPFHFHGMANFELFPNEIVQNRF